MAVEKLAYLARNEKKYEHSLSGVYCVHASRVHKLTQHSG